MVVLQIVLPILCCYLSARWAELFLWNIKVIILRSLLTCCPWITTIVFIWCSHSWAGFILWNPEQHRKLCATNTCRVFGVFIDSNLMNTFKTCRTKVVMSWTGSRFRQRRGKCKMCISTADLNQNAEDFCELKYFAVVLQYEHISRCCVNPVSILWTDL